VTIERSNQLNYDPTLETQELAETSANSGFRSFRIQGTDSIGCFKKQPYRWTYGTGPARAGHKEIGGFFCGLFVGCQQGLTGSGYPYCRAYFHYRTSCKSYS